MQAIKTNGLTKKYKDFVAVDHINLNIAEGELYSLLGVNGAGKTTTIKMLTCLSTPTEGDAFLLGNSITSHPDEVKKIISVSTQETAIAPNLSVLENLRFMTGVYGLNKAKASKKIDELVTKFHLDNILSKRAKKLSGGWQRKLSIALALISEPKILFLDEPTLGLDVLARAELWDIIRELKSTTTIVLTTHYMEEAEALSDRIGIMRDGKLLTEGTPLELINNTKSKNIEEAFIKIVKGEM